MLEINNFPNFTELYNGNISAFEMSEDTLQQIARIFRYDGLNRLKKQNIYFYHNGMYSNSLSYNEQYTYDKNGNILTLQRYKNNEQKIDELKYNYYTNTNQLSYITDNVNSTVADYDIDTQQPNNYRYDRAGNLIVDRSEKIALRWTDDGKLKQIYYVEPFSIGNQTIHIPITKLNFSYDVLGNRLTKSYYQKSLFGSTLRYTDIYIRDIQGNVIANYQIRNDSLFLTELPIYGAERLGVLRTNKFLKKKQELGNNLLNLSDFLEQMDIDYTQPIRPYRRLYEITDWLGNVRVVISDRKYPVSYNPLRYVADVRKVTDYYSYGMGIGERSYEKQGYKYTYNGKEQEDEQRGIQDYGMREYSTKLGRFLSADPLIVREKKYVWLSPYQFAGDMPIWAIDRDGLEPKYPEKLVSGAKLGVMKASELKKQTGARSACNIGVRFAVKEFTGRDIFADKNAQDITIGLEKGDFPDFEKLSIDIPEGTKGELKEYLKPLQDLANEGYLVIGAAKTPKGSWHVVVFQKGVMEKKPQGFAESSGCYSCGKTPQVLDTGREGEFESIPLSTVSSRKTIENMNFYIYNPRKEKEYLDIIKTIR